MNKDIFSIHADLMQRAAAIIDSRIEEIEQTGKSRTYPSEVEAESDALIGLFTVRSLQLYRDTLSFIASEVMHEDHKHHRFLLPHGRTLLDIHARFLHLLDKCSDKNSRALTCLCYAMLTSKDVGNEGEYVKWLQEVSPNLLKYMKIDFPNISELNFSWVKKNGFGFAKRSELLTPEIIKKYSDETVRVFSPERTYKIYSHLSELLHGNPYYYTEDSHNERFWVVSMGVTTTGFIIELIDKYTIGKVGRRDLREWLKEVNTSKKDFISLWRSRVLPAKA